ncbi:GWT1-like protein [Cordyceps fumosorosea ARSEF 2679]|uniref:GPI-anchored wall transfer protein n=1 Tax=Cordyceps fumosorosea (strain ARSEF 2679) TaxID=1081104 RepID=A0A162MR05_CORFA|nr:GWT1-like protein [Cordyceps fumosorosea ARSEF 2679]OAA68809.1 GWT1-like protein [Cordyceps fumosorosea ARSEF 2679]
MSNSTTYKQRKEDFVSNLSGGPVSEINNVTAVALVAVLLWSALQARHSFFQTSAALGLLVDYGLNVCAILLATTLYSDAPLLLCIFLATPVALVYMLPPSGGSSRKKRAAVPPPPPPTTTADATGPSSARSLGRGGDPAALDAVPVKPFLTTYRGSMQIITYIAILAVDFRLFPRRFAKVETWGTSLMDLGVGSYVFTAGVVAARPVLKERASGRALSPLTRLLRSLRHSVPLLALGFVRLLSVKGLEYAEHATEYGVHWNFFFTLGFLPPFVALFQEILRLVPSYAALSMCVVGLYELALSRTPLKAYILTAPRGPDLVSMNREGIFSFLGYLAIFLAGQDLGMFVLPRKVNPRSDARPGVQRNTLLMTMAVWAGIWVLLYNVSTSYKYGLGLTVSRRLANLPYVLWVAAFNSVFVLGYCLVDTVFFPAFYNATDKRAEREAYEFATSKLMRAFNRNGLGLFLVANLLTGLVNMTVPTLDVSPAAAMAILLAYTGALSILALVLDAYNISIKL